MKKENITICNVCQKSSNVDTDAIYLQAYKNGEEVHICTSCMPHIIHGNAEAVKSNEEIRKIMF